MLPPFTLVHRSRPARLVARERRTGFLAPYAATERDLSGPAVTGFRGPGALRLEGWYDGRVAGLAVTDAAGRTTRHRSRRHGRPGAAPDALATTLTGPQLTVLTRAGGTWTPRAKVDLTDLGIDAGDPELLAGLEAVDADRAGTFGQLGLRDVGLVTEADGTPYTRDGRHWVTATHAGPGFFATGHTGVWSWDPGSHALEHHADLFVRRGGAVLGDHAAHLVRDGDRWLFASSTWGDFDHRTVGMTLATSTADLLTGEHVLDGVPLEPPAVPTRCVGTWDPHLTRIDGHWHLAFVAARKFFDFYPALARARGADLDDWELLGAATDRRGTEGPLLTRLDGAWRVLAADGPDNPRRVRRRFPVLDLAMAEVGALDAPYPGNLPWPTLLEHDGGWTMLTFDGTPYGGAEGGATGSGVAGYGTHGDVLVLRTEPAAPASHGAGTTPTGGTT